MSDTVLNFKKGFTMFLKNKLINNISWIKNTNLLDILNNQQIRLNIEKQYRFSLLQEPEKENLNKILNLFKKETLDDFFNNRLTLPFKLIWFNETEYFIYMLWNFLLINDVDKNHTFLWEYGIEMYNEELVYEGGHTHRDYIYTLTDFSKSYYKLFITVLTYCENNKNILKAVPHIARYTRSEQIKEILDKNELTVIAR